MWHFWELLFPTENAAPALLEMLGGVELLLQ